MWNYGELPETWHKEKIGEYSTVITDYVANGSFASLAENVQYRTEPSDAVLIRLTDYNNNFEKDFVYIDEHAYEFLAKSKLNGGEIIISNVGANVGTVFKCPFLNKKMSLAPNAIMLKTKGNDDFFYYWFLSRNGQHSLKSIVTGSAQPKFNKTNFKELEVPVPPIEIQEKIASFLLSIDKKIELNRQIIKNLEAQMQATYKAWFVDYLPFGGERPADWEEQDIYSVANIIYGAPFASKAFNTDGEGKPIIRIRDLKEQEFVTYTTEIHPKGYLLQKGDIVVGMDGEFRPYIWGNEEAWLNQRVCVFENIRENGKAFVFYTIKPQLNLIEQTQVATTVIHIGKKDFDKFKVDMPDGEILDKFDNITAPMFQQIINLNIENKRLVSIRDSVLPKLVNGEISVEDLNY